MKINERYESMQTHIANAYNSASNKGAKLPENKNLQNLASTIDGIQAGGGETREIIVELPSGVGASKFTYFQVNEDIILFSSESSKLWRYRISDNSYKQLNQDVYSFFKAFQIVGNKCLIGTGGTSDVGLYLYNPETDTVEKIYSKGNGWCYFKIIGDKCFIGSDTSSGGKGGVLVYSIQTESIIASHVGDRDWKYFYAIGNDFIIMGNVGILYYNTTTNTIEQLTTSGMWDTVHEVDDGYLIYATNTNGTGILLFESATKTITQIYDTGYKYIMKTVSGNKVIISSTYYTYTGILLYDSSSKTITQIYDVGYDWRYIQIMGDKCLIGGEASADLGILLYNSTTNTIQQIYTTGYRWGIFQIIENGCLITPTSYGGSDGKGILLYDDTTETITRIYTNNYGWRFIGLQNSDCLISNTASNYAGIYLYNNSTKTITQIFWYGYYYDTYNNGYISASDKSRSQYIPYYDETSKTITKISYYIGEI